MDSFHEDSRLTFMNHEKFGRMLLSEDLDEKLALADEIQGFCGPWKGEPHRVDWKHEGLDCFIKRNSMGAWCGYASVPEGHVLHGLSYNDVYDFIKVTPHGGFTYANPCQGCLCHETEGEDKVWWFGFDCAHAYDWIPTMGRSIKDIYRDVAYVTNEVNALAEAFSKVKPIAISISGLALEVAENVGK